MHTYMQLKTHFSEQCGAHGKYPTDASSHAWLYMAVNCLPAWVQTRYLFLIFVLLNAEINTRHLMRSHNLMSVHMPWCHYGM